MGVAIGGRAARGSGNQMPNQLTGQALWFGGRGLAVGERRRRALVVDDGRATWGGSGCRGGGGGGGGLRQVVGRTGGDAEDGLGLQGRDVLRVPRRLRTRDELGEVVAGLLQLSGVVVHDGGGTGTGIGIGTGVEIGLIEGYRVWPRPGWGRKTGIGVAQDLARWTVAEIEWWEV